MTRQANVKRFSVFAPIPMADLKPMLRGATAALLLLGLLATGLLVGCGQGRWVVEDLTSYSYRFGPVAAPKPFAPKPAIRVPLPTPRAESPDRQQRAVRPGQ